MLNSSQEQRLRTVVANALGLDPTNLPEDASPQTVAQWTSLNHLVIMAAVEEAFAVTFTMEEMASVQSLTDIRRLLSVMG